MNSYLKHTIIRNHI